MTRFYCLEVPSFEDLYVVVDSDQEEAWKDTKQYFRDCGIDFDVTVCEESPRNKCHTPCEVSDIVAGRDS